MSGLREALVEHLARRYWEHGMGAQWDRPTDAPEAPFPAYAGDQEKAECRAYVGELLSGFDFDAHAAEPAPPVSRGNFDARSTGFQS